MNFARAADAVAPRPASSNQRGVFAQQFQQISVNTSENMSCVDNSESVYCPLTPFFRSEDAGTFTVTAVGNHTARLRRHLFHIVVLGAGFYFCNAVLSTL